MASSRLSKLASGSPMPMNTILVSGVRASLRIQSRTAHTWLTISAVVRLRRKPMAPVRQKVQPMAQPTWEETHRVLRSSSGMSTDSITAPSSRRKANLTAPSPERSTRASAKRLMRAEVASTLRNSLARSVICSNSVTPGR